jgi:hypothetical protein
MDTTDESTASPEPIYEQMVNEADDATRSALTPAESPESDGGQSDGGGSS